MPATINRPDQSVNAQRQPTFEEWVDAIANRDVPEITRIVADFKEYHFNAEHFRRLCGEPAACPTTAIEFAIRYLANYEELDGYTPEIVADAMKKAGCVPC